ncbi:MAG: cytidyltransferase [Flavobacteriaceae bacterium]|nr:cytidyltransferase [Flavobacteriaceae bacterium]|tara:strand:+ start:2197 stop:2544 length:348 start_codon:yes stop_codon:yes gene_type:complete
MNFKKPTVQLLGRFQPFHDGHFALFKEAIKKTGQVCIMVRDTGGTDKNNPFDFDFIKDQIENKLLPKYKNKFVVLLVPNITNISYGRDVGYKIEEINLPDEIKKISATEIRKIIT